MQLSQLADISLLKLPDQIGGTYPDRMYADAPSSDMI